MQAEAVAKAMFGVDISKAVNPLRRKDFEIIIDRLGKSLNVASLDETRALKAAVEALDVDWANMTTLQQDRVFSRAAGEIKASAKLVVPKTDKVMDKSGNQVVGRTKVASAKEHELTILAGFNSRDKEVMRFNRVSNGNFITTSIGERADAFDFQARESVASGLDAGLGRKELVDDLQSTMQKAGLVRKREYYNVVAASFANRSRTWGQLSSYDEAAIKKFGFEAMLDEVTTNICRLMHGKIFEVSVGINLYQQTEDLDNPMDMKSVQPWVRDRRNKDGDMLLQIKSGDEFKTVARVLESAVGRQDEVGRFSQQMSDTELMSNGVVVPPLHGGCRSILVPDL